MSALTSYLKRKVKYLKYNQLLISNNLENNILDQFILKFMKNQKYFF